VHPGVLPSGGLPGPHPRNLPRPTSQVVGMKSKPTQNPGPGEDAPALPLVGRGNPAGVGLAGRKAGERTTLPSVSNAPMPLSITNALRGGET
jgi:hypothetical protein